MPKNCLLTLCMSLFLFSVPGMVHAQNDTLRTITADDIQVKPVSKRYSPRKATLMSAALPGLGQAYTKKYWKIPILYAGAGVIGYFFVDQHQSYVYWRDAYIAQRLASEANLELPIKDALGTPYRLESLASQYRYNRRNRDLNVILAGLLYALNILDANVTAHLKDFDLSEDLSLSVKPSLYQPGMPVASAGVSVTLNLK